MIAIPAPEKVPLDEPYLIHPKQEEFLLSPAFIRGFCAGRGCGKTKVGAIDMISGADDGDELMAVSPSYVILEDTTYPAFVQTAEEFGVLIAKRTSPFYRVTFATFDGGKAECVFRSGDNPESLRGPSKKKLWLDEASLMTDEVMKWGLPVLRFKEKDGFCMLTFTPRGKRHWTFGVFFELNTGTEQQRESIEAEITKHSNDSRAFAELRHAFKRLEAFDAGQPIPKYNTHLVSATTLDNPFAPLNYYANMKSIYTEALAQQELGGEFVDLEGQMFSRHWFAIVEAVPRDCIWVRYWDKGGTEGGGCPTVGLLLGYQQSSGRIFIVDVQREQLSAFKRNELIKRTAEQDAKDYGMGVVHTFVEQEGGSGGKESMELTIRDLVGHNIRRDIPGSGGLRVKGGEKIPGSAKIIRAQPFAAQCEAGNVFLVRGNWNETYREELCAFPESKYADQVDASSGAFNALRTKVLAFYGGATQAAERIQAPENRHGLKLERKKV